MTDVTVEMAPSLSRANNVAIKDKMCGCYSCLHVFKGNKVSHFIDHGKTARCPECDIDAVLPNVTDVPTLERMQAKYFAGFY
jgi:hypothetical protein